MFSDRKEKNSFLGMHTKKGGGHIFPLSNRKERKEEGPFQEREC